MLLRLYNDNSELIDHSKNRDREAKAKDEEAKAKQEISVTTTTDVDGGVKLDAKESEVTKSEEKGDEPWAKTETAGGEKMETEA